MWRERPQFTNTTWLRRNTNFRRHRSLRNCSAWLFQAGGIDGFPFGVVFLSSSRELRILIDTTCELIHSARP
jgi:hypothetical protein